MAIPTAVPGHFLVITTRGPAWDHSRGRRSQKSWREHAAFMDGLVDEGVIVLGGPLADPDEGDRTALLLKAESEDEIRRRMREDPWSDHLLRIQDVQRWSLWLGDADRGAS